jgi:hypothetical protein
MNLSYTRNNYENAVSSLLEIRESDIARQFRGHFLISKLPKHIPQLQPKIFSQYRHIAYKDKACNQTVKCSCLSKENSCPKLVVKNTEQIHLKNLRRNLQRRLQVAQAKENYDLVAMLKKECQQLKLECQVS